MILSNTKTQIVTQSNTTASLNEFRRVVMPMIRKIMPTLVASQLVGVQPMSDIFSPSTIKVNVKKLVHCWNCECQLGGHYKSADKILEWLSDLPKSEYWFYQKNLYSPLYVNLYNEEAVTAFKLRWTNSVKE